MQFQKIHRALDAWYRAHGRRDLPWRNTASPYAIWVSEVMLQQTQVATVLEHYYFPFLERFPTVERLAAAELQEVLKAWEGLGYYRRARNLHKAARQIMVDGSWLMVDGGNTLHHPSSIIHHLLALPGIGCNTAHAIAAFAFHLPVPVMEANVKRVLCRVFALASPTEKTLWEKAEALLNREHPFDYNQAMMDIGALVCTKAKPQCGACPLSGICAGGEHPEAYPLPVKKKRPPVRQRRILAYYDNRGRYLVRQREGEFLHGLWGFVEEDCHPEQREGSHVAGDPSPAAQDDRIGSIKQVYSHFMLEAEVFRLPGRGQKGEWKMLEELELLPLSGADKKVVALLKGGAW